MPAAYRAACHFPSRLPAGKQARSRWQGSPAPMASRCQPTDLLRLWRAAAVSCRGNGCINCSLQCGVAHRPTHASTCRHCCTVRSMHTAAYRQARSTGICAVAAPAQTPQPGACPLHASARSLNACGCSGHRACEGVPAARGRKTERKGMRWVWWIEGGSWSGEGTNSPTHGAQDRTNLSTCKPPHAPLTPSRHRHSREGLGQGDSKWKRQASLLVVVQRPLVQAAAVHTQQPAVGKLAGQNMLVLQNKGRVVHGTMRVRACRQRPPDYAPDYQFSGSNAGAPARPAAKICRNPPAPSPPAPPPQTCLPARGSSGARARRPRQPRPPVLGAPWNTACRLAGTPAWRCLADCCREGADRGGAGGCCIAPAGCMPAVQGVPQYYCSTPVVLL